MSGKADLTFLHQFQECIEVNQKMLVSGQIKTANNSGSIVCTQVYRMQHTK